MPGKCTLAGSLLLLGLLITAACAQGSGSLARGQTFTVTVIGLPRTAYVIWPMGTSFMTGEPGDQPPIIPAGQVDVVQDPPDGPYLIGSTPISGGGTILEDVPPSTLVVPNTSYYAQVRTDASGHGVVLFRTSAATATGQQFHITVENPANPDEEVAVVLGVPAPAPTPMIPLPLPTTMETPFLPLPTTTAPVPPVQPTPIPTPVPLITPSPGETPAGATPVQEIPLPAVIGIAAAGIGVIGAARMRGK